MKTRLAGICVPLFSLRSQKSLGVGDFHDLKLCIRWAKQAGLNLVQILPVNDTSHSLTERDAYPYSILSSFALHPIYLHVEAEGKFEKKRLCYLEAYHAKWDLIQKLFAKRGKEDLASSHFQTFFEENAHWLRPYAVFCHLRDQFKTSNFRKWGEFSRYSPQILEKVGGDHLQLIYFVQFHLHCQFKEVKEFADEMGVILKGDFPIGVHANSLEAWMFPQYFRWEKSIGAPPDFYNNLGQNWGFPSYDWEVIKQEGFQWLKMRLAWFARYFHALRLDHVLGYFRLWEIPTDQVRGLMGTFFPSIPYTAKDLKEAGLTDIKRLTEPFEPVSYLSQAAVKEKDPAERDRLYTLIENRCFLQEEEDAFHPRIDLKNTKSFKALPAERQKAVMDLFTHYFEERQEPLWKEKGREKLAFMKEQTGLILCAEDIGVIPKCVGQVLKELSLPNLYVQRMPKDFALEFEDPKDFPELSVCTPSNHDTLPLRGFWEKDEKRRRSYAKKMLEMEDPPEECTPEIAEMIIRAHMKSPSRWAIFLLQDLFAIDGKLRAEDPFAERINDPADPEYVWDWRMHMTLEELIENDSFSDHVHRLVKERDR